MELRQNHFEQNLMKTVALLGFVRFLIALFLNKLSVDGYPDLILDIGACLIFLLVFVLASKGAKTIWFIIFFYIPLISLLLISFYIHNGLMSSTEVNAFALVIIFCLTSKGRWPIIFTSVFLIGVLAVLFLVESDNLKGLDTSEYFTNTFTLLIISLAVIWLTYHAKKVFDSSHEALLATNSELTLVTQDLRSKHETLNEQNQHLNQLKTELEEKILARTTALKSQKEVIEEYMQLTLIELMKPYEKTAERIKNLEVSKNDEINQLIIESGQKLDREINKIKEKLGSNG